MQQSIMSSAYSALEGGYIPDVALRPIIRRLCRERATRITKGTLSEQHERKMEYIEKLKAREVIADSTDKANEQHYEVSTDFILNTLGPRSKYSCSVFPSPTSSLGEAEEHTFNEYTVKAKLPQGGDQGEGWEILDLGCGWGSLGLFLAERYPKARITMLSNSRTQKIFIDDKAKAKGFANIEVITGDVNFYKFEDRKFDRILSIEMFEHMKAYSHLLEKVSTWLKPKSEAKTGEALLFIHIFCHRTSPYDFELGDGWMARTFFTGGTMPSFDLFTYFQKHLTLQRSWFVNGSHYGRTSEAWLQTQDKNKAACLKALEEDAAAQGVSKEEAHRTFYRFRVFYLTVAEFFALDAGHGGGEEWGVGWYLFEGK